MHSNHTLPLTHVPVGKLVRLVEIKGGREITHRLVEMCFNPGVEFKIIQDAGGPLLLAIRDSRIALGRSMAFRVLVQIVGN